jgi:hypothetical protein
MQSTTDLSTAASRDELALMRRFIEHAPREPRGAPVADLVGWWLPEGNYLCAKCAARIIERGCHLPNKSAPVWTGQPRGTCGLCD